MALRKLELPLDTNYTKHFKIDCYGFFVNSIPPGMEAYLIIDHDPSQQINLSAQTKIPREKIIKEFTFINVNPLSNRVLNLFYAETINDFIDLPDAPTAGLEGTTEETNELLDQINSKVYYVDTNNVKLSEDHIGLAKESTLSSMIQYIDEIETKLDNLNISLDLPDYATDTSLSSINSRLYSLVNTDFATENTLNITNYKLDSLIEINQNILNLLSAPNIVFDTAEQFININTTQDFTITITNDAVFDPNDYAKTATATDQNLVVYTCVYYNNLTKELTFNADPVNGNTTATITVNYMKA